MTGIRIVSKELEEKAIKELNEDPKRVQNDLKYIKDWLKKQPHINARTDDQFLLTFLRGCKFSLERTKEKLDMYYTMRTLLPEFFSNRDPLLPELQEILKLGCLLPLPYTETAASPSILFFGAPVIPETIKIVDLYKVNMMILEVLLMENDNMVIAGQYFLQDMGKMSLAFSKKMTPTLMKKAMTCFQNGFPIRPKGMFAINTPSFFEILHNMMKVFLQEKLKKRMHIFGNDYEELYETIPKHLLPKEYGGDAGTLEELTAFWKKKIESYRDYFLDDEKYKTNESKRLGKPKTSDEMFGIEGSFRKLDVD